MISPTDRMSSAHRCRNGPYSINLHRVHTNVVVGKQITESFYGEPHTKSYYLGCSTGGRQGLKSVEDFPEDFDGVVAGMYNSFNLGMLRFKLLLEVPLPRISTA